MISAELLELVRCPQCRGELEPRGDDALTCAGCKLAYPVVDGIPQLLVDEAKPLGD
jgi:uncharacterized protein YbaR (Trm112 family)